jgi:hypothetical protein
MKKNDFYLNNISYWNTISASYSIIWKFMSFVFHTAIVSVMFRSINHQIYCLISKVNERNVRKTICCIFGQLKLKRILLQFEYHFFNYMILLYEFLKSACQFLHWSLNGYLSLEIRFEAFYWDYEGRLEAKVIFGIKCQVNDQYKKNYEMKNVSIKMHNWM